MGFDRYQRREEPKNAFPNEIDIVLGIHSLRRINERAFQASPHELNHEEVEQIFQKINSLAFFKRGCVTVEADATNAHILRFEVLLSRLRSRG
ncbi:MAG: hypothetical protein M1286_01740 [Candidatus Marsarchaeota archaeon]|nr:hypothetical protein [Candidatus Marsarchaeota archaeon]